MNLISITPSSNKSKKFTATFKYKMDPLKEYILDKQDILTIH